jgi:hypothetical protein
MVYAECEVLFDADLICPEMAQSAVVQGNAPNVVCECA